MFFFCRVFDAVVGENVSQLVVELEKGSHTQEELTASLIHAANHGKLR